MTLSLNAMPPSLAWSVRLLNRYFLGLYYWVLVLLQVRGDGVIETLKLVFSAAAAPVLNLRRFGQWQFPAALADVRVNVPGVGRFECRADTDELFQVIPSGQAAVRQQLESKLRPGSVFVDAGANIGFFTLVASRLVGPEGRVISIEMMPETAQRLRKHVEINGLTNVRIVESALSDRAGDHVTARLPEGRGGQATISVDDSTPADYARHQDVVTTTLDEVLTGIERIDLLKIDVEGHEAKVFAGGQAALKRTQAIVLEYWPDDPRSMQADAALRSAGFTMRLLDAANKIGERV